MAAVVDMWMRVCVCVCVCVCVSLWNSAENCVLASYLIEKGDKRTSETDVMKHVFSLMQYTLNMNPQTHFD